MRTKLRIALIGAFVLALVPVATATANDGGGPTFDRDGDINGDLAILRGEGNAFTWYWTLMPGFASDVFGDPALDIPVVGDFDSDGRNDPAVFRFGTPSVWHIRHTSTGAVVTRPFGVASDIPLTGDFDGDSHADLAVWRAGTPATFFMSFAAGGFDSFTFGAVGDAPLVGDYDGDGRSDVGVRRADGNDDTVWHIRLASGEFIDPILFGTVGDWHAPGDYRFGDGRAELTVVRTLENGDYRWFGLSIAPGLTSGPAPVIGYFEFDFGNFNEGDEIVQTDYDGTGSADAAVWRPTSPGRLFVRPSEGGAVIEQPFGDGNSNDTSLQFFFNCMQNISLCAG